jgi:hypothetical protein
LEGISKVTAAYTMGSLTATMSMADDKDKNSNTNTGGKASTNLSLAYAANGLAATFATDESSQWWVNSTYDLGAGAQVFATIDHTEFAVVGVSARPCVCGCGCLVQPKYPVKPIEIILVLGPGGHRRRLGCGIHIRCIMWELNERNEWNVKSNQIESADRRRRGTMLNVL